MPIHLYVYTIEFTLSNYLVAYLEVKWECLGSSCYTMSYVRTVVTKAEAEGICQAMGAHLMAPETEQENNFLTNLAYRSGKRTHYKNLYSFIIA